jgi:hypothetical protein
MSTYSINAVLNLSGQGVSSDTLSQNETQVLNVTQPTVESGALFVTAANMEFDTFDGTINTGTRFLYMKNTGTSTDGNVTITADGLTLAAGFIVVSGSPNLDTTLTLISTDGTSKVYTAKDAEDVNNRQFKRTGTFTEIATSIENCIEAANGHGGKIAISRTDNIIRLTQAVGGTAGNTTITSTLGGDVTVGNFLSGGTSRSEFAVLKPGEWMSVPIKAGTDLSISSTIEATPIEYGWWTLI